MRKKPRRSGQWLFFSVVFDAVKMAQATKGQGWTTVIYPPSFCTDVKSRTCEDLASVTGVQLPFLSGELPLVSLPMKRGHHRGGRDPRPFIWMDI